VRHFFRAGSVSDGLSVADAAGSENRSLAMALAEENQDEVAQADGSKDEEAKDEEAVGPDVAAVQRLFAGRRGRSGDGRRGGGEGRSNRFRVRNRGGRHGQYLRW